MTTCFVVAKGICAIRILLLNLQRLNHHNLKANIICGKYIFLYVCMSCFLAVEPVDEPAPSMTLIVTSAIIAVVLIITLIVVAYCYRRHKHMFNEVCCELAFKYFITVVYVSNYV